MAINSRLPQLTLQFIRKPLMGAVCANCFSSQQTVRALSLPINNWPVRFDIAPRRFHSTFTMMSASNFQRWAETITMIICTVASEKLNWSLEVFLLQSNRNRKRAKKQLHRRKFCFHLQRNKLGMNSRKLWLSFWTKYKLSAWSIKQQNKMKNTNKNSL